MFQDLEVGRNSGDANLIANIDIDIDIDIGRGRNTRQFIETRNSSFGQNHHYPTVEDDIRIQMNHLGHTNRRFHDRDGNGNGDGNSDNNHDISFGDSNSEQATHNPITCHGRYSNRYVSKRRNRNRDRSIHRHIDSQMEKCTTHHIRERMSVRKLDNIHKERYKRSFADTDTDTDADTDSISSNDSDILLIAAPIFSTTGWYQLSSVTDIGHLFLNAISKIKERRERERGNDFKNSNGSDLRNISFVDESQIDEHHLEVFQLEESHSHSLLQLNHLADYANNIKFSLYQKTRIDDIIFFHLRQIIQAFVVFLNYFVAFICQVSRIFCKRFLE